MHYIYAGLAVGMSAKEAEEIGGENMDRTPTNLIRIHYENVLKTFPPVLPDWENLPVRSFRQCLIKLLLVAMIIK